MLHFWVEEKLNVCVKLQCPVLSNTKTQYPNIFFISTCQKTAVILNKKYIKTNPNTIQSEKYKPTNQLEQITMKVI
jgi:hypothetical protein